MRIQKQQAKLIGLENITDFLEIIFNSSNIVGEKPLSTMIIAPVSNGKTTCVKQFKNNKCVKLMSDCTAWGVLANYANDLKDKKISHIIIPDLLNVLVRRKTTVEQLLLFINVSSEEGLEPSRTFSFEIKEAIPPFGWVLCITKEAFLKKRKFFDAIGFSSRMLFIYYEYDLFTVNQILNNLIQDKKSNIPNILLKGNNKPKRIEGNNKIFEELEFILNLFCNPKNPAEKIRLRRNLQVFLKSCAYTRGDIKVTQEDLNKLKRLLPLLKPITHQNG